MSIERRNYLDIAKGIAILYLVVFHADWAYYETISLRSSILSTFFVISGALMAYSWKEDASIKDFALHRCSRMMYPYLVFSFIYFIFMGAYSAFTERTNAVMNIAKNLISVLTLNGLWVTWYFSVACIAEIIVFAVAKKLGTKALAVTMFFAVLISGVFSFVSADVLEKKGTSLFLYTVISLLFLIMRSLIAIFSVGLGVLLSNYIMEKEKNTAPMVIGSIVAVLLAIVIGLHLGDTNIDKCTMENPLLFFLSFALMSFGLIGISMLIRKNRILEFFGKNSLVVMVTNIPIPVLVSGIVFGIITSIVPDINKLVAVIPAAVVLILCQVLLVKIVNKHLPFLFKRKA